MRTAKQPLKSGLSGESEAFARLQAEYVERYSPATMEERFLVDTLIRNEWLLRRLRVVKDQLAEICEAASPPAKLLERRIRTAERSYKQASNKLERMRRATQRELADYLRNWSGDSTRWVM